jgi:hypothetical protein
MGSPRFAFRSCRGPSARGGRSGGFLWMACGKSVDELAPRHPVGAMRASGTPTLGHPGPRMSSGGGRDDRA